MLGNIKNWAQQFNDKPQEHLDEVKSITLELSKHIQKVHTLRKEEIQKHIKILTCFTIGTPVPFPKNSILIRAVEYEGGEGYTYNDVQRISYIAAPKIDFPRQGRINKNGSPLFYGCLSNNANSRGTVLSECNATAGSTFNFLEGRVASDESLQLIPIGVNDYFRRGMPTPYGLHQCFKDFYDCINENAHPTARMAILLCDAFLNDVLTRKEHDNLYDITSLIGEEFLKPAIIDGVLYSSTKFEGYPTVAIKPISIDKKVTFEKAYAIAVQEDIGYGMYLTRKLKDGVVDGTKIKWE
jgi:hypothetical protein